MDQCLCRVKIEEFPNLMKGKCLKCQLHYLFKVIMTFINLFDTKINVLQPVSNSTKQSIL